jgi:hypothetical protein
LPRMPSGVSRTKASPVLEVLAHGHYPDLEQLREPVP